MPKGPHHPGGLWPAWVLLVLVIAAAAWGQSDGGLRLDPQDVAVGLKGHVQAGAWGSLRLTLHSPWSRPRPLICQWETRDGDGEVVRHQRRLVLNENRSQSLWLYAPLSPALDARDLWRVRVLDEDSGEVLAGVTLAPPAEPTPIDPYARVIAVTDTRSMGLQYYEKAWTQQARTQYIRGIRAADLPDRWHGLAMLSALVWTAAGGSPDDPAIAPATLRAIREWIRRGGHLVVVLPSVGDTWTASPLADVLPITGSTVQSDRPAPYWLGAIDPAVPVEVRALDPRPGAVVLEEDGLGNPNVVTGGYGFGRVTVVGVDMTDPRITRMNLPSPGGSTPWSRIFGWRGPAFGQSYIDSLTREQRMPDPDMGGRDYRDLDVSVIPALIDMRGQASLPLLLAVLLFALYWLLAGPVGFAVLRQRGQVRHAWLAFLTVVAVFSLVAWAGAWLMRPQHTSLEHFTVLDVAPDARTVRAHAWFSLLVPTHGDVDLRVDPDREEENGNLLAAPGLSPLSQEQFPDPRTYLVDAAAPHSAVIPFRSTSKTLQLEYVGPNTAGSGPAAQGWPLPRLRIAVDNNWPRADLTHNLPGALENVVVVFPGQGTGSEREPWVWSYPSWAPGQVLRLQGPPPSPLRLAIRPPVDTMEWEGFLGRLTKDNKDTFRPDGAIASGSNQAYRVAVAARMLSFYDYLPPPRYLFENPGSYLLQNQPIAYRRSLARRVDLTAQVGLRRCLIIAVLPRSPLPAPLTVNGRTIPSTGTTIVRWLVDLE